MYWIRVFLPGMRVLAVDFQRDVTSSGCDPRKWGGTGGADSHPSQPVPWDMLWSTPNVLSGFSLSTDHFMLLEIQYTLIFSLSSLHFTTLAGPTNAHNLSLWFMYEILLPMATSSACFAVSLLSHIKHSDHRDEQINKKNHTLKSAVTINQDIQVMTLKFYTIKEPVNIAHASNLSSAIIFQGQLTSGRHKNIS